MKIKATDRFGKCSSSSSIQWVTSAAPRHANCLGGYNDTDQVCASLCMHRHRCKALKRSIDDAVTIAELPEFLSHESPLVQALAKERLEELNDKR